MKTGFKTIIATAAVGLIGYGAYKYQHKTVEQTKPETELEALRKQYVTDSLNYVNADSVKAKAKLAELTRIYNEYITGKKQKNDTISEESFKELYQDAINKGTKLSYEEFKKQAQDNLETLNNYSQMLYLLTNTGDSNIVKMHRGIADAQTQIDIATGKVFMNTKAKLEKAEQDEKARLNETVRKDSLISEFDKVVAE